jgi:membrane protease YdiL (CAAX protease family)
MDRRSLLIFLIIGSELALRLVDVYLLQHLDPFFGTPAAQLLYTAAARVLQAAVILYLALDLCGVKASDPWKEVLAGVGVSLAFGAAVLASDLASRHFMQDGWLMRILGKQYAPDPVLYFLVACGVGPFVEELFFRGVLYAWIRERMPAAVSVLVSAVIFASLHPGFLIQLVGGLLFAVVFEWRRSIWAGFILHAAANLGIWIVPWIYPFW